LYYIHILQQHRDKPETIDVVREGSEVQSILTGTPHGHGEYFVKVTFPYMVDVRPNPRTKTCVQANLILFMWLRTREDPAPDVRACEVWLFESEASSGISLGASMEAEVTDDMLRRGPGGPRGGRVIEV